MVGVLEILKNKFCKNTCLEIHVIESFDEFSTYFIYIDKDDPIVIKYNYPNIEINSNKKNIAHVLTILWAFLNENIEDDDVELLINNEKIPNFNNINSECINFLLVVKTPDVFYILKNLDFWFESPFCSTLNLRKLQKKI